MIYIQKQLYMKKTSTTDRLTLENENVIVRITKDQVWSRDKKDIYNEESLYTQTKRWLVKAQKCIVKKMDDETKFWDIVEILDMHNIKVHRYCWMD